MARRLCTVLALALAAMGLLPAAARAGSYEYASFLRLSAIIPGTEQVVLLPDGGFEAGGAHGWKKKAGRWGAWTVGPHVVPAPGVCGKMAVRMDAATGSGSHQIDGLPAYQPDWRQVFSLYLWFPGTAGCHTGGAAPGVPGEQHICFGWPDGLADAAPYVEGFYVFGDFRPKDEQVRPASRVSYNIKGGTDEGDAATGKSHPWGYSDAARQWRSVIMAGDNLADTAIVDFAPPVLRYAAAADFRDLVALSRGGPPEKAAALVRGPAPDFAAAVAALEAAVKAGPDDYRTHNQLAFACMAAFAADLTREDLWRRALEAWDRSLALKADQPEIRYWRKVYGGYVPPPPRSFDKPPADVPTPPAPGRGPGGEVQAHVSALRLREILPGTERATLVPNGDFEAAAPAWTPVKGREGFRVGRLGDVASRLPRPALWWGNVLYCEAPLSGPTAAIESAPVDLEAGAEYVVSAYVAPLGDETAGRRTLSIGLAGQPCAWWGWPGRHYSYTVQEGLFVFATIRPAAAVRGPVRIAVGPWEGGAPPYTLAGKHGGVGMVIDQVAVTRASQFRPPLVRGNLHLEMRALLAGAAARVAEGTGDPARPADGVPRPGATPADRLTPGDFAKAIDDLRAVAQREPQSAAARNHLAAACLMAFLQDPAQADRHKAATDAWQESLRLEGDQPNVRRLTDLLGRYRPVPSAVVVNYAVDRGAGR